ncbi:hypothetical protein Tco_0718596 [Tanacetum coccineum]
MSSITAQQTKLDLELVPKENRLDIRKCNGRIPRGLTPREPTFQVVLDAIALTPCYPAFLITADVPEVYMHQFWNSVYKHDNFYRFKIDRRNIQTYFGSLHRYLSDNSQSVTGVRHRPLPSEEDTVSYLNRTVILGENHSLNDLDQKKILMKEVRKKNLRNFHKTHPSSSGMVAKKPPSVDKIRPTITISGNDEDDSNNDHETSNEDNDQENKSEEQESDSEQDEESEDDDQEEEDNDVNKSDEESDDVIKGDKEIVQGEGVDAEMIDAQQGNENLETTQEQVVEDAHVTISTVTKKTEVSLMFMSTMKSQELRHPLFLQYQFLLSLNHHLITALEKKVAKLKKDPLHTQVTTLVDEHLDTRLGETIEEFMNFLSKSLTARIKEQVKDQLPQILPKEVSNFSSPVIESLIIESHDEVTLEKVSSQPHSTYEDASTLTEFELKKILIDKMEKSESYLAAPEHKDCYDMVKSYFSKVRIYQKSQENSQKRASTDTRIRRVQKEAKDSKPKPEKSNPVKNGQQKVNQ